MRNILLILAFLTVKCFGQEWKTYPFDHNLSVDIPENFDIIDTLGQHIVRAQIDNALIMVQRLPGTAETTTTISDKAELIKYYKGFQEGLVRSHEGKLIKQNFEERDGLHTTQFSYRAAMGDEEHIRYCFAIFLNENWYSVHFWEIAGLTDELQTDRDKLFSSIRFPPGQTLENQLTGTPEYRLGYKVGKVLAYVIMGAWWFW